MENKDGIWLDDILCKEKLSGTEKLWRDIYRICDEFYLLLNMIKYPLTSDRQEYSITIYARDKVGNWGRTLFSEKGMELEVILRKLKKQLEQYKTDHKEYHLQKPGGGEMV